MPKGDEKRYKLSGGITVSRRLAYHCSFEEITILETLVVENNTNTSTVKDTAKPVLATDPALVGFQLGAWAGGLSSFLSNNGRFALDRKVPSPNESFNKEIRIARSALQRCAQLSFVLTDSLIRSRGSNEFAVDEIRTFSAMLREPIQLSNALINVPVLSIGEWNSWSTIVVERFYADPAFSKLVAYTEAGGGNFLPEKLKKLISDAPTSPRIRTELDSILPRFGKVLRLLDIVGEMLERDEPLKSALLIFARVSEQTQELVDYLNQRVSLHQEEPDEFTNVLDGASYTASIELKKVVQQELSGVTSIRPATTVYARTETAYALLSESFQQILAQFAKQIDPSIDIFDLFPNFRHKLEQSQVLRKEIYTISQIVRLAEKEPDGRNVEKLNNALIRFMEKTVRFLFYKDVETFERFVEEILVTKQKKDLVPIVHRFGAYLETLFAQVNMRAVLETHPFETGK